ncbi:MAG: polyphosphate polymerase domain-containing protein [Pseudomonadales bacterium]|jgi:hypothetical protein|nr:polyphosphate polymerase domain-containing protein [Pseudomonadales bacterium]MCP5337432.1 polyphosphate polymerase domain-containing protein [Pseudomonadales bacterium]
MSTATRLHPAPVTGPAAPGVFRAPPWLLEPFAPISLEQLNAKADMLERRDNKYVVDLAVLRQALAELAVHFDILEIDGLRDFTYDTCYFDDAEHSSYHDHHKGRRIRSKVRMRTYVDAGLCFVEVKLKYMRGMTIKERLQRPVEQYGVMDPAAREFVETCHHELYGRAFGRVLQPTLRMRYQRVTLVARQGGERMTIDLGVRFEDSADVRTVHADTVLVETKSDKANGIADKILRTLHQHPTNSCSKYCVAAAALNKVGKYNKFLVPLRKLGMVPDATLTRAAVAPPCAVVGV